MLIEFIILALLIGLIGRGNWHHLANLPLRHLWSVIGAAGVEIALSFIVAREYEPFFSSINHNYLFVQLIVYGLLFFFFYQNRQLPGLYPILLGTVLNFIVIAANRGLMPVDTSLALQLGYTEQVTLLANGQVAGHTLFIQGQSALPFLADIINIPPPYPLPKTISVGDLFLTGGACWLILKTLFSRTVQIAE